MIEWSLRTQIAVWRWRRSLTFRSLAVLLAVFLASAAFAGYKVQRSTALMIVHSHCMPYALRVPVAWQLTAVRLPNCGTPVLFDEYHFHAEGQDWLLSVEGVLYSNDNYRRQAEIAGSIVNTAESASGQAYAELIEQHGLQSLAHATFDSGNYSYDLTIAGGLAVDPHPILAMTMNGWHGANGPLR